MKSAAFLVTISVLAAPMCSSDTADSDAKSDSTDKAGEPAKAAEPAKASEPNDPAKPPEEGSEAAKAAPMEMLAEVETAPTQWIDIPSGTDYLTVWTRVGTDPASGPQVELRQTENPSDPILSDDFGACLPNDYTGRTFRLWLQTDGNDSCRNLLPISTEGSPWLNWVFAAWENSGTQSGTKEVTIKAWEPRTPGSGGTAGENPLGSTSLRFDTSDGCVEYNVSYDPSNAASPIGLDGPNPSTCLTGVFASITLKREHATTPHTFSIETNDTTTAYFDMLGTSVTGEGSINFSVEAKGDNGTWITHDPTFKVKKKSSTGTRCDD